MRLLSRETGQPRALGSTDIYGEKGALCEDFGESKEEEVGVFNTSEI
jgi:hypothetical protein